MTDESGSEFGKLAALCTRQGDTLDSYVQRGEKDPEWFNSPEIQAELRRELEYAALLISSAGKELSEELGV